MGAILSSAYAGQPLPRGEYPTLKWPEGCTHLAPAAKQAAQLNADVAELQRKAAEKAAHAFQNPTPDCIVHVKALGADWVVAVEKDGPHEAADYQFGRLPALPARDLLDKVKHGGKWFDAREALPENFFDAIQEALDAMERNA